MEKQEKIVASTYGCDQEFRSVGDPQERVRWEYMMLYPDQVVVEENIRPLDWDFIETLTTSLFEQGQLQPCIGDTVMEGDKFKVRILAGQHRLKASQMLFEYNEFEPLLVRVADRTLTSVETVELQMSENLQNKMTSAQDAYIIADLWEQYRAVYGSGATRKELAGKVGRSYSTVCEAIRFVRGIHPKIQQMVDEGILSYSVALTLPLPSEGLEGDALQLFYDKQISHAVYFVVNDFTGKKASQYLKELKRQGHNENGTLFGNSTWEEIEKQARKITMRNQVDKRGGEALGWFERVFRMVTLLGDNQEVELSASLRNRISLFEKAIQQYRATF